MKPELNAYEPTAVDLALATQAYELEIISFNRDLEKLEPADFLPRYNRVRFRIRCLSAFDRRPLFVTVRRHGSKIGADNFYTVPFFADDIQIGSEAEYDLLSFDSFNYPFESISIEMCRPEDYAERRVSGKHIERARQFASKVRGKNG